MHLRNWYMTSCVHKLLPQRHMSVVASSITGDRFANNLFRQNISDPRNFLFVRGYIGDLRIPLKQDQLWERFSVNMELKIIDGKYSPGTVHQYILLIYHCIFAKKDYGKNGYCVSCKILNCEISNSRTTLFTQGQARFPKIVISYESKTMTPFYHAYQVGLLTTTTKPFEVYRLCMVLRSDWERWLFWCDVNVIMLLRQEKWCVN